MCFVFCQSMNNEITLSLTLKLYGRKGLISTTCMMWMVNKYISKIHWGNNRTQNDNWDSANWWTHLWIWTRCAIASFALYWLVMLTQEEDRDQYYKHIYKQRTVAFCNRNSNSSSSWHVLVLCLSLLTGAYNNHIIWWPTTCWICACRGLRSNVMYNKRQVKSGCQNRIIGWRFWECVGSSPPILIFWMYGFKSSHIFNTREIIQGTS